MGTTYNISYFNSKETPNKDQVKQIVESILEEVNRQMSTYLKTSEISRFNRLKKEKWQKISPWFAEVLEYSLYLAKISHGAFDPTIGPLVNLWGFGPRKRQQVPTLKMINKIRQFVGYKNILLNKKTLAIKKLKPQVYLDLSATAKGFGVDKVSEALKKLKIKNFLVEVGGEVKVFGKNNTRAWRLGIESPDIDNPSLKITKVIELKNEAMATSGNYRNFFLEDNKKYAHTINYKTGKPIENSTLSVTIIHQTSCMKADALATLFMALEAEEAYNFAKKYLIESYIISKNKNFSTFIDR